MISSVILKSRLPILRTLQTIRRDKESGYGGREVGDAVLDFYTKTVYINYK
jgi:hypothetical protein